MSSAHLLGLHFLAKHLLPGHWLSESAEILASASAQVQDDTEVATGYAVMVAAKTVIESLALDESPTVLIQKVPVDQGITIPAGTTLPAIILSPWREQMRPSPIGVDDVAYGVICVMIDADEREGTLTADLERSLLWRETIRKALIGQRVIGLESCLYCEVAPFEVVSREGWASNYFVGALLLNFVVRELHGA